MRDVIDRPEQVGVGAQSLLLIGGDAQSRLCLDSAPFGSPLLAAAASGVARNLDEAGRALARPHSAIEPDTRQAATYDEAYSPYRRLFQSLTPSSPDDNRTEEDQRNLPGWRRTSLIG